MSLFVIILLIVLGIVLLLIEFLVIPGVTVAGIGGLVHIGTSIYSTYKSYGSTAGNIVLVVTFFLILLATFFALRSKTWRKVMLNTTVDGKASESFDDKLKPGDHGKAVTRLAPMGNAMFGDIITEVKTMGEFVDAGTEVEVVKVHNREIVVKPITRS
ncbi:MAG TPA: NfeD family protein [Bacteroidales bacterium]|nr:NfeD family protein [Bacteroidales bacterium]